MRSQLTHADRREEYARDREVEPLLARFEVAAYDVLFNKAVSRDPDITRRMPGLPLSGAIMRDGTAVVTGPGMSVGGTWLDPYGTFTLDFKPGVSLAEGWFSAMPKHQPTGAKTYRQQIPVVVAGERQWVILDVRMRDGL